MNKRVLIIAVIFIVVLILFDIPQSLFADKNHANLSPPSSHLHLDRVVIVYRHGLRAPLNTEIGARAYATDPWPVWSTPNALLTPHGRAALRLLGIYDKELFSQLGLFTKTRCPSQDELVIYTDTDSRTMASGNELREGMAPGCQILLKHRKPGTADLTFTANAPGSATFEPNKAIDSINAYTEGGPHKLVAKTTKQTHILEEILGCRSATKKTNCDISSVSSKLSADNNGIHFSGPIMITSGTAEVFILQYAEGMPMKQVGWGRASLSKLTAISRLHALLFDIYDRSPYMSKRTSAEMAPRIRNVLTNYLAPKVMLYVGHDNNIAALASLIGASFKIPTYGLNDPALGGGLGFELLTDTRNDKKFVRVFYQAQTLDQIRKLSPLTLSSPPATLILSPKCAQGDAHLCSLRDFTKLLSWSGQKSVPMTNWQ